MALLFIYQLRIIYQSRRDDQSCSNGFQSIATNKINRNKKTYFRFPERKNQLVCTFRFPKTIQVKC
jgi:hypothetical protein